MNERRIHRGYIVWRIRPQDAVVTSSKSEIRSVNFLQRASRDKAVGILLLTNQVASIQISLPPTTEKDVDVHVVKLPAFIYFNRNYVGPTQTNPRCPPRLYQRRSILFK